MGGCVGGLLKLQSTSFRRTLSAEAKGSVTCSRKYQWSSNQDDIENTANFHPHEAYPSDDSFAPERETKSTDEIGFVNQGVVAWNEIRRNWVGEQTGRRKRKPREPVIRRVRIPDPQSGQKHTLDGFYFEEEVDRILKPTRCTVHAKWNTSNWSMTYDDLLTSTQPFPERIPLPEMVDFLVDTWHEEGLYD